MKWFIFTSARPGILRHRDISLSLCPFHQPTGVCRSATYRGSGRCADSIIRVGLRASIGIAKKVVIFRSLIRSSTVGITIQSLHQLKSPPEVGASDKRRGGGYPSHSPSSGGRFLKVRAYVMREAVLCVYVAYGGAVASSPAPSVARVATYHSGWSARHCYERRALLSPRERGGRLILS